MAESQLLMDSLVLSITDSRHAIERSHTAIADSRQALRDLESAWSAAREPR